jgi:hypothetical protein
VAVWIKIKFTFLEAFLKLYVVVRGALNAFGETPIQIKELLLVLIVEESALLLSV